MKTFKINVFYNDAILFSTELKNVKVKSLDKLMAIFKEKFPFRDGYDFEVLGYKCQERNYTLRYVLPN